MNEIDERQRAERIRRGMLNAAANTFGLLKFKPHPSDGGWRMAAILDGELAKWLCDHVHQTAADAAACKHTEPLTGHTVVTPQDP